MLKWLATSMREDDRDLAVRITDDPLATISSKNNKLTEIYSINRLEMNRIAEPEPQKAASFCNSRSWKAKYFTFSTLFTEANG
jgi:hypothetical protein